MFQICKLLLKCINLGLQLLYFLFVQIRLFNNGLCECFQSGCHHQNGLFLDDWFECLKLRLNFSLFSNLILKGLFQRLYLQFFCLFSFADLLFIRHELRPLCFLFLGNKLNLFFKLPILGNQLCYFIVFQFDFPQLPVFCLELCNFYFLFLQLA